MAGDRLAVLEVNPRIQGSSWLLSQLEERRGGDGCLVRHAEALLGRALGERLRPATEVPAEPPPDALDRESGTVGAVPAGGQRALGDAAVTVTALPAPGTILTRGAIAARLDSPVSLATPSGTGLAEPDPRSWPRYAPASR